LMLKVRMHDLPNYGMRYDAEGECRIGAIK
jgi:hypothetical protein